MSESRQDRFDQAFKSWAERSPKTPPEDAARQVMARLPERRPYGWFSGHPLRLAAAGAGLTLLLIVGWYAMPRPPVPTSSTSVVALPPLSDDVVLLWLDHKTPLYLTVAPPATEGDSR